MSVREVVPEVQTAGFRDAAAAENKQAPVHRWVPWIAGYSSGFVEDAFARYLPDVAHATILDPFAGVGTTLIEAQLRGWKAIGFDINAYAIMACRAKLGATVVDPGALAEVITDYRFRLSEIEERIDDGEQELPGSSAPSGFRTRIDFYSAPVLSKVLHTLDYIEAIEDERIADLMRLAFASVMVSFSNYTYEPSLGSRPGAGKPLIENASVVDVVSAKLALMHDDLLWLDSKSEVAGDWELHEQSFLEGAGPVKPGTVDLIVTSPPYLNNYHYVRNTRPQMYWLGFVNSPKDLRKLEETNFGKFWQTVREEERIGLDFDLPELDAQIESIRCLKSDKRVYGGDGWANYAATYYNDTHRFAWRVSEVLKPGGAAVVVVGNSLLQGIELKVEEHLGQIGEMCGLVCEDIHIVRKKRTGSSIVNTGAREDSGTKVQLYDAATVLRKPR